MAAAPPRPRALIAVVVSTSVLAAGAFAAPARAQEGQDTTTSAPPATTMSTTTTTVPEPVTPPPDDGDGDPGGGSSNGDGSTTTTTRPRARGSLIPPPLDLDAIGQLAGTRRAEAVARAQALADAANARVLEAAAERAAERDAIRAERDLAQLALDAAAADLAAAEDEVDRARRHLAELAVESYQLAMTDDPAVFVGSFDILRGVDGYLDHVRTTSYSEAAAAALRRSRTASEQRATTAGEALAAATAVRDERQRHLDDAQGTVDEATKVVEFVAADGRRRVEDAEATGTALTSGPRGPSILGVSVVPAKYMAEFVRLRGRPHPSVDVESLAAHYVAEGEAEGVTGDIAFAQSILETGWFNFGGSMVAVSDHNYAGIGACDSCSDGHGFPSPQLGVRAQIQLLRTYAQPGLTGAELANPSVGRAPERSSVRGCCGTWMELTGVWATATDYGVRILQLYNELLIYAAGRQRADLAALATAQAAPVADPSAVPPPN